MFFWRHLFFFSPHFLASSSFTLHRTLASDADPRRPLEPAGVEGHAADEVEVVPGIASKVDRKSTRIRLAIQHTPRPAAVSHGTHAPRN
jgi:hypothetical protein